MRLVSAACLAASTLLLATNVHAGEPNYSINLSVVGGTAVPGAEDCEGDPQCVYGEDGDTVVIQIDATIAEGVGLTLAAIAFAYDPAVAALDVESSTEEPFNLVNGVLLSPIGQPAGDIQELDEGFAVGWEAQTLTQGGAPGAATFTIGTAAFTLGGGVTTLSMSDTVGVPGGTIIGDGDFENVTNQAALDEIRVLPEPMAAMSTLAVLGTLGLIVRRKRG